MRNIIFLVVAILFFLLAALSNLTDSVNLPEFGVACLGLVFFAAAHLPESRP